MNNETKDRTPLRNCWLQATLKGKAESRFIRFDPASGRWFDNKNCGVREADIVSWETNWITRQLDAKEPVGS